MIEYYVEQVSTFASKIDNTFLLIFVLAGFWFLVAEFVLLYFVIKYRAKEGGKSMYIDGTDPKHTRYISIPHALILICDVVIVIFAVRTWVEIKQTMPTPDQTIRVIGQQWAWSFVHPGPDNKLDTADDIKTVDELHVVNGQVVQFELVSPDVLHSFSIPVFRLKQDVIPGRTIKGWFKTQQAGTYDIQCAEMCGIGHGVMGARIVVQNPDAYAAWVAAGGPTASRFASIVPQGPSPVAPVIRDDDGDSVADNIDNCPGEKGTVENKGCLEKQLVAISGNKIELSESVFFKTGSNEIDLGKSQGLLDNVARVLKAHTEVAKVKIGGHTDNQGDPAKNLELSKLRAAAVKDYLVKLGIDAARLESEGFGDTKPLADNSTDAGRAQNRRVELEIE